MSDEKFPLADANNIQPDESHGHFVPDGSPENAPLTEATADHPKGKMFFRYDPEHEEELIAEILKVAQAQHDRVVAEIAAKNKQDSEAQPESKDER